MKPPGNACHPQAGFIQLHPQAGFGSPAFPAGFIQKFEMPVDEFLNEACRKCL